MISALFCFIINSNAQNKNINGQLIAHFIQMTNWSNLLDPNDTQIRVSVISDLGAYTFLSKYYTNKYIAGKSIIVDFPTVTSELRFSNVIYIGQNYPNATSLLKTCSGMRVLTIWNNKGGNIYGAPVSFYADKQGKLIIEISERACKLNRVVFSNQLLKLSTIVD